ncbi:MAG: outer membrane lipoprotein-sorting protein [Chthonomonadales bacterium]
MRIGIAAMMGVVLAFAPSAWAGGKPSLEALATDDLHDLQASVTVVKADQTELAKINRDFGFAYRLRDVVMRYKQPDKLRMEGRIGDTPAEYVVNGSTRTLAIPRLHFRKRDELGEAPGRRYSLLDLGLVARSDLPFIHSKYLRDEDVAGVATNVFELTFRGDSRLKYVLWVDPRTRVVRKRQWFDGDGKLKATFLYKDVKEVQDGLWFPTRVEILNGEGALAAVTQYSDLRINQGLADGLFEVS